MPINIEEFIEKTLEKAFAKALEQVVQNKVEALFQKAFANGAPLSQKLEEKIAAGFQRLLGDNWDVQNKADLEVKLLQRVEAMEQGDAREMTARDWDRLRQEYLQRHSMIVNV